MEMRVKVLKVNPGAYYAGRIYDFWVYAELKSGAIIKIFDDGFDLRDVEGKEAEILLHAFMAEERIGEEPPDHYPSSGPYHVTRTISGTVVKSLPISPALKRRGRENPHWIDYFVFLDTKDGAFLLSPDGQDFSSRIGEYVTVSTGRLDLVASEAVGTRLQMIYDTPETIFEQVTKGLDHIRMSAHGVIPALLEAESVFHTMQIEFRISGKISPDIINRFGDVLHNVYLGYNRSYAGEVTEMDGLIKNFFYREKTAVEWRPVIHLPEDDMAR